MSGLSYGRMRMGDLVEALVFEQSYMADTRTMHYEMVTYVQNPGFSFVCRQNGVIVGLVKSAVSSDSSCATVDALCVSASHRNRGIGRRLLECSTDAIRKSGIALVELFVSPGNDSATRLYESVGFRTKRKIPNAYMDGSPALYMTLE